MTQDTPLLKTTLAGILALGSSLTLGNATAAVPEAPKNWEKCAGIAKAGMNDCGALDESHSCAGHAKDDNAETEWVYVPEGTCSKITGGRVAAVKPAK